MTKLLLTFAVAATLTGCAPVGANFTATGNVTAAPRPVDCAIDIYTTPPKGGFEEIGLVEFTYDKWDGHYPESITEVKRVAHKVPPTLFLNH